VNGEYQGKVALKWKRGDWWNVVLRKGRSERYLRTLKIDPSNFNLDCERLKRLIDRPLRRVFRRYECYSGPDLWFWSNLPERGFKVLDLGGYSIWVRVGRRRLTYSLCLCDGYRIVRGLKYLSREEAFRLRRLIYASYPPATEEEIRSYLRRLGIDVPETKPKTETEPSFRPNVEDEGYGGLAQDLLEDGELLEEVYDALEDGDIERAAWLLGSRKEAEELGLDQETIEQIFGEDNEEDSGEE